MHLDNVDAHYSILHDNVHSYLSVHIPETDVATMYVYARIGLNTPSAKFSLLGKYKTCMNNHTQLKWCLHL